MGKAILAPVAPGNLLSHPKFEQATPLPRKRRRGPLPRGITHISHAPRLRIGAAAEIVRSRYAENTGLRVVITEPESASSSWVVKSLGRAIRCHDGSLQSEASISGSRLRRVWRGLSENDRIKLQLLRSAS